MSVTKGRFTSLADVDFHSDLLDSGSGRRPGGNASGRKLARPVSGNCNTTKRLLGVIPAFGVTAATKDVGGFRFAFAIRAAIIAVLLGVAMAARMGALLLIFHAIRSALDMPFLSEALLETPNMSPSARREWRAATSNATSVRHGFP